VKSVNKNALSSSANCYVWKPELSEKPDPRGIRAMLCTTANDDWLSCRRLRRLWRRMGFQQQLWISRCKRILTSGVHAGLTCLHMNRCYCQSHGFQIRHISPLSENE